VCAYMSIHIYIYVDIRTYERVDSCVFGERYIHIYTVGDFRIILIYIYIYLYLRALRIADNYIVYAHFMRISNKKLSINYRAVANSARVYVLFERKCYYTDKKCIYYYERVDSCVFRERYIHI